MMEKDRVTLRIAIIADTVELAQYYYDRFIYENKESVLIPGRNRLILSDGTIVEKYGITQGLNGLRGKKYDQILMCYRNSYEFDLMRNIMDTLRDSQVPSMYWFLCYEEDE